MFYLPSGPVFADAQWHSLRSAAFRFFYQPRYADLIPRLVVEAETSLQALRKIFDYTPSERITVIVEDTRDSGAGSTTALPHNLIRLDVAPLRVDYELLRFDDPLRWLLSHELVHVVIADQAAPATRSLRSRLGKVSPVAEEPFTVPFALLTSPGRMTPTWHQEAIATFWETWLNGGFGRVLGGFDEMYFRTLVHEQRSFFPQAGLDFDDPRDSFLLGSLAYLYGTRFLTWLALRYDLDRLMSWYRPGSADGHTEGFAARFERVFGAPLASAWDEFEDAERAFQRRNLDRLARYPWTEATPLGEPLGWVSPARLDGDRKSLVFAHHAPHQLASIQRYRLDSGRLERLADLPTPKLVGVADTAFDPALGNFFYTTHNQRGYRDLWVLDVETRKRRRLFIDARLGALAVHPEDHSLWGMAVRNGRQVLAYSDFPYRDLQPLVGLESGQVLDHLQFSPNGRQLAATLHHATGRQELIAIDYGVLSGEQRLKYVVVSDVGQPEHPCWGLDGQTLYWDAYTNGVANLFRSRPGGPVETLSNTPTGLFHPEILDSHTLLAYRFTSEGFQLVSVPDRTTLGLAAILYRGQAVLERFPELARSRLQPLQEPVTMTEEGPYRGLANIRLNTLIPVVNANQDQFVPGFYAELGDELRMHRILLQAGYGTSSGRLHFAATYHYRDLLTLQFEDDPASFYDVVNERKRTRPGRRFSAELLHYWRYDRPETLTQRFLAEWGKGIADLEAGQVEQQEANFLALGTGWRGENKRRTIGSVDDEQGHYWDLEVKGVWNTDRSGASALRMWGDIGLARTWLRPHNVARAQLAAGRLWGDPLTPALFFFGGFGNRILEDELPARYRETSSLPGLGFRAQPAEKFVKLHLENSLPPLTLGLAWGPHYARRLGLSVFGQSLMTENAGREDTLWSLGIQANLQLKHFFTMDSTISFGVGKVWGTEQDDSQIFLSWKWFRD